MLPKVTGYEEKHAFYVRMHLLEFHACQHRPSAEDFFLTRCTQHNDACKEYFELFPAGERKNELEPVLWKACAASDDAPPGSSVCYDCCGLYRSHLATGSHRAEAAAIDDRTYARAKASLAASKAESERQRKLDLAKQNAVWSGPLVELAVDTHPEAQVSRLTFSVAGRAVTPTASYPPTLTVPAAYPVDVCYAGGSSRFSLASRSACSSVAPRGNRLRVPLTRVFISFPKAMDRLCGLSLSLEEEEGFWLMPGPHAVSCMFLRDFAGHGSQSTEGELSVSFDAPQQGGTVHVLFSVVRNQVRGEAIVSERWEGRRFPLEVRGD